MTLYQRPCVVEAIEDCTSLLFDSGKYKLPPVDNSTFKELLTLRSSNVILQTNNGYFRQTDTLAMGSPPAPLIANGWMSKCDCNIKDDARLYSRYMNDILREINKNDTRVIN